jgi:HSP20 family molecular chaperone IbpA
MPNLIPTTWKDPAEHVRSSVMDAFDRMGHWLPEAWRGRRARDEFLWPATILSQGGPAVDVADDDDAIRITAELPGLDEKDFTVEVQRGRLVIRGEKKAERQEKKRDYYCSECSYGSFTRSIPIPIEIDAAKATADYKNGVLKIALPKTECAPAKRVRIDVS